MDTEKDYSKQKMSDLVASVAHRKEILPYYIIKERLDKATEKTIEALGLTPRKKNG